MSEDNADLTRREALRNLTLTSVAGSLVTLEAAQHAHQAVKEEKSAGAYRPKFFTPHEYQTLSKLAALIIPADDKSKGALEAAAPEFIDFLCSRSPELATIYSGGLAWLDREMQRRYSGTFAGAKPGQQTALLDLIAYRKNTTPELAPGIRFFEWVRKMTVDAFYTSKVGIEDLGYMGNTAVSQFSVPAEALNYALKRSGLT